MNITIRNYHSSDQNAVRSICCMEPNDDPLIEEAILTVFCEYYIHEEPDNCFVIADDHNQTVGYLLCAADFQKWEQIFRQKYISKSSNPITTVMAEATIHALKPFSTAYPAHLHMNLLPEYRGMHLGTRLMDTLKRHLRTLATPGLMLDVAKDNLTAQAFYQKNGFHILSRSDQEYTMGIKL